MQTLNNDSNFGPSNGNTNSGSANPISPNHATRNTAIGVLAAGLVIALAGNGYLLVRSNHLNEDLARTESGTQAQISKLNEATATLLEQDKQRLDVMAEQVKKDVQSANVSAAVAVRRARSGLQEEGVHRPTARLA